MILQKNGFPLRPRWLRGVKYGVLRLKSNRLNDDDSWPERRPVSPEQYFAFGSLDINFEEIDFFPSKSFGNFFKSRHRNNASFLLKAFLPQQLFVCGGNYA